MALWPNGQHTALCYSNGLAEQILHLRFHHSVELGKVPTTVRIVDLGVDALRQPAIRGYFEKVASRTRNCIPYGVTIPHDCLDKQTGAWLLGPHGPGLTCATFVIAVLSRVGLELLQTNTWQQRPEDFAWREQIVALLNERSQTEQAGYLMQHDRCVRIRPPEVAAGASYPQEQRPVAFEVAVERSVQILAELTSAPDSSYD